MDTRRNNNMTILELREERACPTGFESRPSSLLLSFVEGMPVMLREEKYVVISWSGFGDLVLRRVKDEQIRQINVIQYLADLKIGWPDNSKK
ncbi:MAG: hypothetical protein MI923_03165 [Phycisphaerales bacterium]|nr:hypothetical protein [Phycisphaerales bacterium]